jgi:hypothetical protein
VARATCDADTCSGAIGISVLFGAGYYFWQRMQRRHRQELADARKRSLEEGVLAGKKEAKRGFEGFQRALGD